VGRAQPNHWAALTLGRCSRIFPDSVLPRPRLDGAAERELSNVEGVAEEAFHYTFSNALSSIEANGLRQGTYATTTSELSPMQAQIDLALPPNRGLTDSIVRIDLNGLREAGYVIPQVTQVGRSFNMPGGGYEMQFNYPIPPEFITVIK